MPPRSRARSWRARIARIASSNAALRDRAGFAQLVELVVVLDQPRLGKKLRELGVSVGLLEARRRSRRRECAANAASTSNRAAREMLGERLERPAVVDAEVHAALVHAAMAPNPQLAVHAIGEELRLYRDCAPERTARCDGARRRARGSKRRPARRRPSDTRSRSMGENGRTCRWHVRARVPPVR